MQLRSAIASGGSQSGENHRPGSAALGGIANTKSGHSKTTSSNRVPDSRSTIGSLRRSPISFAFRRRRVVPQLKLLGLFLQPIRGRGITELMGEALSRPLLRINHRGLAGEGREFTSAYFDAPSAIWRGQRCLPVRAISEQPEYRRAAVLLRLCLQPVGNGLPAGNILCG